MKWDFLSLDPSPVGSLIYIYKVKTKIACRVKNAQKSGLCSPTIYQGVDVRLIAQNLANHNALSNAQRARCWSNERLFVQRPTQNNTF